MDVVFGGAPQEKPPKHADVREERLVSEARKTFERLLEEHRRGKDGGVQLTVLAGGLPKIDDPPDSVEEVFTPEFRPWRVTDRHRAFAEKWSGEIFLRWADKVAQSHGVSKEDVVAGVLESTRKTVWEATKICADMPQLQSHYNGMPSVIVSGSGADMYTMAILLDRARDGNDPILHGDFDEVQRRIPNIEDVITKLIGKLRNERGSLHVASIVHLGPIAVLGVNWDTVIGWYEEALSERQTGADGRREVSSMPQPKTVGGFAKVKTGYSGEPDFIECIAEETIHHMQSEEELARQDAARKGAKAAHRVERRLGMASMRGQVATALREKRGEILEPFRERLGLT